MTANTTATTTSRPQIDLLDGAFWGSEPHHTYAWMRANEPVYHDEANHLWAVTSYHDLKAVERDPATFSNAGGIRPAQDPLPMMIDMDDPEHLRRRKLVNKGFTPRRVRDSQPVIEVVCDAIIDSICEQGECDFVRDIAAPLPMIMIGDALGVAPGDRDQLLRWSDDMVSALSGSADPELLTRAATAFVEYTEYATRAIEQRRIDPTDDLMSILVHAEVDGDKLDLDSLVQESLLILVGGDETTRHVLSGGLYEMLRVRDRFEELAGDRPLIDTAVEEMLRWVSPIKNMARTATRDVELGGVTIPEGEKLLLVFPSANRDEAVFERADEFDVRRTPNEHVAFGFGTHFCLGASLARLEIRTMVDRVLTRLPDLELTQVDGLPRRPANFVSGLEAMPVRFTPTAPVGATA